MRNIKLQKYPRDRNSMSPSASTDGTSNSLTPLYTCQPSCGSASFREEVLHEDRDHLEVALQKFSTKRLEDDGIVQDVIKQIFATVGHPLDGHRPDNVDFRAAHKYQKCGPKRSSENQVAVEIHGTLLLLGDTECWCL